MALDKTGFSSRDSTIFIKRGSLFYRRFVSLETRVLGRPCHGDPESPPSVLGLTVRGEGDRRDLRSVRTSLLCMFGPHGPLHSLISLLVYLLDGEGLDGKGDRTQTATSSSVEGMGHVEK